MRKCGKRGFVLLELLVAVLLVAGVMVIAARLLLAGAGMTEAHRSRQQADEAGGLVWRRWTETGGLAALARTTATGMPEVLDFPDETWLPPLPDAVHGSVSLWRRRLVVDGAGASCWEIECRLPGQARWRWWARVLAGEESGEP